MAREPQAPTPAETLLPLRERKKARTFRAIQNAAFELFERKGYEATTVEDIAQAAEIGTRTFFRYFPSKERVVLDDEYDPVLFESIATGPPDASIFDLTRDLLTRYGRMVMQADRERIDQRMRLIYGTPALANALHGSMARMEQGLTEALARSRSHAHPTLDDRIDVALLVGVLRVALETWMTEGAKGDPVTAMIDALDRAATRLGTARAT